MAFLAFLVITVQFVVAIVESYLVVSAGFIFLGLGGSRWTAPYVERYIGLAVSVGIKIMILYLLIGSGMTLSNGWLTAAVNVPGTPSPSMSALDIVGASLIFMAICWQAPKMIAGVIGGSPALSGGDVVSAAATLAGAAYFASSVLMSGGRAVADRMAGSAGAGPEGPKGPGSGGGGSGPSPSGGGNYTGGGSQIATPQPSAPTSVQKSGGGGMPQVSPPGKGGGGGPGETTIAAAAPSGLASQDSGAHTGSELGSYAKTAAISRALLPPSDAAPHAAPPRLNLATESGEE
jgi:type IV secretion system protein TrbL